MIRRVFVVGMVALVGAGCSPGTGVGPGTLASLGSRSITVNAVAPSGSITASGATVTSGNFNLSYSGDSKVTSIVGSVVFAGSGGPATASVSLSAGVFGYSGSVSVVDGSISVGVGVASTEVTVDDDGDVTIGVSDGTSSISLTTVTGSATGIEAGYDTLAGLETTWCQEAQQTLAGVTEAQLPAASIANTTHSSRSSFAGSKAEISPLKTQTWRERTGVDTAAGNNLVISRNLNCKTRSADHLAAVGLPSGTPTNCAALTTKAINAAWAAMTPAQQATFTSWGITLNPVGDIVASAGIEWLTPTPEYTVSGSTINILAHALSVGWNDPAYQLFPDSIRGVLYCTTWSPAYLYWLMTEGAPTL